MAKNVEINGIVYDDVAFVNAPLSGGGLAKFVDTADATATAEDIMAGKTAYAGGMMLTGTGEGGAPKLQSKTVYPAYVRQTVVPDSTYDGLSRVTVEPITTEVPVKQWMVIVPSDWPAEGYPMVEGDKWVATYYNNSRLNIAIRLIRLYAAAQTGSLAYAWSSNMKHPVASNSYYGLRAYRPSGTGISLNAIENRPLTTTNKSFGYIRATSAGDILWNADSAYRLRAGEYSVAAWLM